MLVLAEIALALLVLLFPGVLLWAAFGAWGVALACLAVGAAVWYDCKRTYRRTIEQAFKDAGLPLPRH